MDAGEGLSYRDREGGRGVVHRTHAPWGTRSGGVPLMSMTFDATLKDMARDSPEGFLAAFDRPPTGPVKRLSVDLSTVTTAADLVLGLGEPLEEIIHLDFEARTGFAFWRWDGFLIGRAGGGTGCPAVPRSTASGGRPRSAPPRAPGGSPPLPPTVSITCPDPSPGC